MRFIDYTALAALCAVVGFILHGIGKVLRSSYKVAKTWEFLVQSVTDMADELKQIRNLLQDGQKWMAHGDEQLKQLRESDEVQTHDIAQLRTDVDRHGELIARLGGVVGEKEP